MVLDPTKVQLTIPVPPKDFVDKLHFFDAFLDVAWCQSQQCWSIWRTDSVTNVREHVINVVEPDGSYRPLDDRTINILRMNRYYAEHPGLAIEQFVDKPVQDARKALQSERDDLRHLAKDRTLRRQFENAREIARSVSWDDWGVGKKETMEEIQRLDKINRSVEDQEKERRERELYEAV